MFTLNGALNSFYVLNNGVPQKTYNTKFSLYHDNKVISSNVLWEELDHTFGAPAGSMETVRFAKVDKPLSVIQFWVEERPEQFENYWEGSSDIELDYQTGDFFIYELADQQLYGGIRIVSKAPGSLKYIWRFSISELQFKFKSKKRSFSADADKNASSFLRRFPFKNCSSNP